MRYRVGNIEIDARTSTVHRAGRELSLQPKVFGVLQYLLENRDRVISKDELLQAVWQGESVHQSTIPWSIGHVRDALGQRRGTRLPIETVHKRGYRFTANVEIIAHGITTVSEATPTHEVTTPSAFVGRESVLSRMGAMLEDAAAGRGRLCVVRGVPGIGKTRVTQELGMLAAQRGFAVYFGRLMPEGGSPSFWPWIQILRGMQEHGHAAENLRTLIQSLEAVGHPRPRPERADSEATSDIPDERAARFWLLDAIGRFLLGPGSRTPLLLCIDDVHWADDGTLSVLDFLAPELAQSRILLLVTERAQSELAHTSNLSRLGSDAERVELAALSMPAVQRYIALSAGAKSAPVRLAQTVHNTTRGIPLFVQETVRELIRQHGRHRLTSLDPALVELPAGAKEVLSIGLRGLDSETRQVLDLASVLGNRFELPVLQALSRMPTDNLLGHLETAQRQGLIAAETPQRYRFAHALLQELVYDEIPTAQRALWHHAAGGTLEALTKVEPRHADIARHYYRALPTGTHARAEAAALTAARAAEQVLEHSEAARFYEWALEAQALSPELTARARAELLFATGRAQRLAGQAARCRNTMERMFDLARQHGFVDLLLRGARVLRPTFAISVLPDPLVRTALDNAIQLLDTATATSGVEHKHIERPTLAQQRVLALSHLACIPPYSSDVSKSKQLSEQATGLARSLGQASTLLEALRARLYSLSGPDDTQALLEVADEILSLERSQPSHMTLEAYSARCGALIYLGEQAAADQMLASFGQLAEELQLPEATWYFGRQRAQGYILRGDFDSGIAAIAELHASSRRLGLGYGQEFLAALQRRVRHDIRRDPDPTLQLEEHSLLAQGVLDFIPNTRAQNARYAAERGELSAAQSAVDWLASLGFENIPKEISYLSSLANLAIAVTRLGDLERAEPLYTLLSPYAHLNTPDGYLFDDGSVSHYLALLAATLGWHERVEAHFRTALVMNRDMGRRPQLARTYYDYAVWAAEQDRRGASAQAQELAREASVLAESIGMPWLAQSARSLMT